MAPFNSTNTPEQSRLRCSFCGKSELEVRQLIAGDKALVDAPSNKPLSTAVEEINQTVVKVMGEDDIPEDEFEKIE